MLFRLILEVFLFSIAKCEEIKSLPGLGHAVNFKHYSGYLQASPTRFLHYWFVESQNDPSTDPLMIWFNGGPGCSSLGGLLEEMGPYAINDDGKTLKENPHSWNKLASVLYIESPAGVGFSYTTDGNITHNDDSVAAESYEAIKQFFKEFPNFRKNDLHVFGESYGGVYVPTLAVNIIRGQSQNWMNLKCYAEADKVISKFEYKLNIYDVEGKCEGIESTEAKSDFVYNLFDRSPFRARRSSEGYKSPNANFSLAIPCFNDTSITTYLNSYPVRRALHIPDHVQQWAICNGPIYDDYRRQHSDMAPYIKEILAANVRVLLYFGDTDAACNYLHGQKFVDLLDLKQIGNYKPWMYNGQIGGMKCVYESLTYATVRGAGHLAPQSKPAESQHLVKQFLANKEI